ncbi:histidine phosphatase family protein [Actinokineospora pegani]|uniref:histidine phosphatase family protein n=1 Tax=Actinokineospora pegani TaxID=2654637 RepID=UPI0012EAFB03|nr:histidine phosphatase family protein [Actinokineospora pegani]
MPQKIRQHRYQPPPGATELLLFRHGESAPADPDRRFPLIDGQGDPELAPEGRAQAAAIAVRLKNTPLDAIYASTLRRTVETAQPLADALGLRPEVDPDLREVHLGDWEGGLFRQKVAQGDPVALRLRAEQRWDVIPNAESRESLSGRLVGAVGRIHARHPGRRVAVFTHGGVIAEVLARASGSEPFAFLGADNGSLSHVVVVGDTWAVRRFNDTAHLADDLSISGSPQS